jgi:hypothetical protein
LSEATAYSVAADLVYKCAVEMRRESWAELILDEQQGRSTIPVLMLYYEHDYILNCGQDQSSRRSEK